MSHNVFLNLSIHIHTNTGNTMNDCIELMFALFSAKDDQKKTYVFKNMLNLFVRICVVCQDSFDNIHIQLFFWWQRRDNIRPNVFGFLEKKWPVKFHCTT